MIAFNNATEGSSSPFSHTVGSGKNRILFLGIFASSDTVTAATYDGISMSLIAKQQVGGSSEYVYIYYLVNPASGANNVGITGAFVSATAVDYSGARQTSVPDAFTTHNDSGVTDVEKTLVSVVDNCWFITYVRNNDSRTDSFNSNYPSKRGLTNQAHAFFDSNGPQGAGAYVGAFNNVDFDAADWGLISASFAPAVEFTPKAIMF